MAATPKQVPVQLSDGSGGFHASVNHIDAGVAQAWIAIGQCRLAGEATPAPAPKPAPKPVVEAKPDVIEDTPDAEPKPKSQRRK